jgi:hypothetical protein
MANALYPKTKKRFMAGDVDLLSAAVYAAVINVFGAGTVFACRAQPPRCVKSDAVAQNKFTCTK